MGAEHQSMNRVQLVGRLGSDPELKYTANNKAVAKFTMATNEAWTDAEKQKHVEVEWHRIVVWGNTAEAVSKFLRKGSLAMVEGRLKTEKWEKEGQKHYSTDVVATRVMFLDSMTGREDEREFRPKRQEPSGSTGTSNGSKPSSGASDDEMPPF